MTAVVEREADGRGQPTEPGQPSRRRGWRWVVDGWGLLVLPVVAFLVAVLVVPLGTVLARSFTDPEPGFANYSAFFASPVYVDVLVNTFVTAGAVTLGALLLGFPYAYLMTLASPFWRGVLLIVVLVPFWTNLLVRTFAWVLILRDTGVANDLLVGLGVVDEPVPLLRNLAGVLIGTLQVMLPFAVLPMYATMRGIDRRLVQAAEGLGARPVFAFWRVYAPLALPGVAASTLLVFVASLGFYVTPALLGGPGNVMLGELIVQQLSGVLRWGFAFALAVILLVVTLAVLLVVGRLVDLRRFLGVRR